MKQIYLFMGAQNLHLVHANEVSKHNHLRVKAYYGGAKIVVTLYCFSRVPYLNFNHIIIVKDFHNVFAYYHRSKPKKVK